MGFGQSKVQKPAIKRSPPLQMIDTSLFSNKGLNCPTSGNENMRDRFSEYNWSSVNDCDAALNAQGYSIMMNRPSSERTQCSLRDKFRDHSFEINNFLLEMHLEDLCGEEEEKKR